VNAISELLPTTHVDLEPPPPLRQPLAERVRMLDDGELDLETWRADANRWAELADARYRACTELRPFEGGDPPIRIGVKDTVDVAGYATHLGLRRYRHYPTRTARVLEHLPPPLITAKLATAELALGLEHGCVNPLFPHLDPAGSSTGCAVAVAAHISDLAMGTDTVNSMRHPAAACGVVGLRVTHDERLLDGIFPLSPLLDAPGWIARTADDLAFAWQRLLAGEEPPYDLGRIGIVSEAVEEVEEPAVREALGRVSAALAAAGRTLVPVSLDVLWETRGIAYELCARDARDLYHHRWVDQIDDSLGASTLRALEMGAATDDRRRDELLATVATCRRTAFERFARDAVDVWLLPVADLMPRDLDEEEPPAATLRKPSELHEDRKISYATIASVAGLPSIVFPVALDEARAAPVELQAVGPPGTEFRLIRLAQEVATLVGDLGFGSSRYAARRGCP
jgi:Asp-tRNA(Asn)/Glu-tRNA(Gln) amidotransferase A subunit family amidase